MLERIFNIAEDGGTEAVVFAVILAIIGGLSYKFLKEVLSLREKISTLELKVSTLENNMNDRLDAGEKRMDSHESNSRELRDMLAKMGNDIAFIRGKLEGGKNEGT